MIYIELVGRTRAFGGRSGRSHRAPAHPREPYIGAAVRHARQRRRRPRSSRRRSRVSGSARRQPAIAKPKPLLAASLERALSDDRLAVRSRGGLAALEIARPDYLRRALDVLSELSQAKLYVAEWPQALHPAVLSPKGDRCGLDRLGGFRFCPRRHCRARGRRMGSWLEQMALSGKITYVEALAAALGCGPDVPDWGRPHLDELVR